MKYLFLFAVAVVLLLVICVEAFHLVNSHGCIDAAFQQEILEGIRDVSDRVAYADTEEDIVRVCDAKERLRLTKEQIMNELPKYKQGRYMNFLDGGKDVIDWSVYNIEPLCAYTARIEIGSVSGRVQVIRVVYASKGE